MPSIPPICLSTRLCEATFTQLGEPSIAGFQFVQVLFSMVDELSGHRRLEI